ncbi:MAG: hypothetical protein B7Y84_07665 [Azorhizobium sp. 32-67-21]|nr:MAG: hypothetical protein B7Y84_07665 [Azorhizobium sp. 32-67-21]
MTAIFGVWNGNGAPGAGQACAAMQRALSIYGADRSAIAEDGPVALGVTLARLTPEDTFDRQPLAGGGGRWHLVADLRLDNRPELAGQLGIAAADLATMADAQVLLHAWERWEEATVDHIVGDFAFAVFDARERRLILARDFMGQRPLFYARSGARTAFATMAKGIHALGDIAPAPDLERVRDYLALTNMVGPNSFFAGISRVEMGEMVTLHADGRTERRAWAARTLAASGGRLTAYTHVPMAGVVLDEPEGRIGNEWPVAHAVAGLYPNVEHVAVDAADRMIGDDLERQFHYFEYPALNLCNIVWGRAISRLAARDRHKVLLTGAVGNATISLAGMERLPELFRAGQWGEWFRELRAAPGYGLTPYEAARFTLAASFPRMVVDMAKRMSGRSVYRLAQFSTLRPEVAESASYKAHLDAIGFDPTYQSQKRVRDVTAIILRRLDVHGLEQKGQLGAYGIDARDPTADRRLVDFVMNIPTHLFMHRGVKKRLYQEAFGERLPPVLFTRRPKGQQAADWRPRLRAAMPRIQEELDLARRAEGVAELIDLPRLDATLAVNVTDGPSSTQVRDSHRLRLLRALSVAHFMRKTDRRNSAGTEGSAASGLE